MKNIALLLIGLLFISPASFALSQSHFDSCLNDLQANFAKQGILPSTFATYRPVSPDESVITALNYQPEFKKEVWDYLAPLVDEERVIDGIAAKNRHLHTLQKIEDRYGVDIHHVLGVWGVESNFGQTLGKKNLFSSLATLSCFDRRQKDFRQQFASALKIVQNGDIYPHHMTGSWAGAFGQTQFMPSTFLEMAVDFDGDGRRDIVGSTADALASTANFLAKKGYKKGETWGFEVKKPAGTQVTSDRKNKKPISHWRSLGYTLTDGSPLPNTLSSAGILAPAGSNGPIFLVGKNFDAFFAYNNSENYALAIGHLSDLIAKKQTKTDFATAWPTDDAGISRRQAREIQQALLNAGYAIGNVDGIIGDNTRKAIKDFQQKHGVAADGRAGQKFYRLIMTNTPKSTPVNPNLNRVNITYAPQVNQSYTNPVYNQGYYGQPYTNTGNISYANNPSYAGNTGNTSYAGNTSYIGPAYTQTNTVYTQNSQGQVRQVTTSANIYTNSYKIVVDQNGKKVLVPIN